MTAKARSTTASIRQMILRTAPSRKKSLARSARSRVTKIVTGRSKNLVEVESATGAMIAVIPRMRKILAILEPSTFPIAISVLPLTAARSETISSGILVPIATIVRPIIASDIPHFFASETAPSTRRFPHMVRKPRPKRMARTARKISISKFYFFEL